MKSWEEIRKDNYKPDGHRTPRGAKTTRTAYKYCRKHDRIESVISKCFVAAPAKRTTLNVPQISVFEGYWDDCISNTPTYISSRKQKAALLKAKGLVPVG